MGILVRKKMESALGRGISLGVRGLANSPNAVWL